MTEQNETVTLLNLPFMVLENILSYFPYASMFKFSKICAQFREVAVHRMRLGFTKLLPILTSKCAIFNSQCDQLFTSIYDGEVHDSYKYNMLKMKMTMAMLLSEVRVLQAVSGSYGNDPKWNYFCAYSGEVLDAIYKLIALNDYNDDSSGNLVTVILEDIDKFLYHFLMHVVPDLETNIPYGIKVVDVVDCLRNCNLMSRATFTPNGTLFLQERYQLNNITYLMYPFDINNFTTVDKKLNYILFMLAVNVRYHNFCIFSKMLTAQEEIMVRSRRQRLTELINSRGQNYCKQKNPNEYMISQISHNNVEWQQISPNEYYRQNFIVNDPSGNGRLSFICKLRLMSSDRQNYPVNMPFCTTTQSPSLPDLNPSTIYNFWIDIRMKHLAQASFEIKKSQIKIWSHNGGHELILQ